MSSTHNAFNIFYRQQKVRCRWVGGVRLPCWIGLSCFHRIRDVLCHLISTKLLNHKLTLRNSQVSIEMVSLQMIVNCLNTLRPGSKPRWGSGKILDLDCSENPTTWSRRNESWPKWVNVVCKLDWIVHSFKRERRPMFRCQVNGIRRNNSLETSRQGYAFF